jgi:hypothetical protein
VYFCRFEKGRLHGLSINQGNSGRMGFNRFTESQGMGIYSNFCLSSF